MSFYTVPHPVKRKGSDRAAKRRIRCLFPFFVDVSTFYKRCDECKMLYRYQECDDGLHNFDDRHIFTLNLMLFMREYMKVYVADIWIYVQCQCYALLGDQLITY